MSHLTYTEQQLHDLTEALGMQVLTQGSHDLALSALLSAYATIAVTHSCCTQECANLTMRLSLFLAERAQEQRADAAARTAPPSTRVH